MRRIEHLINDVKFSTNEQSSRFPNARFNRLFNDAQQEIQRVVHLSSSDSKFFVKEGIQDLLSGTETYSIPSDAYTESSISNVGIKVMSSNGDVYSTLRYLSDRDRGLLTGYIVGGSNIHISPIPRTTITNGIRITYTSKLPELSSRIGTIKTIGATDIKLTGFDEKIDISNFNDYFCIVDKDGVIIDSELYIESYKPESGKITFSGAATASVGDYVVLGKVATTNSILPDACEKYLMMFVERTVHYINSSRGDLEAANIFTSQEKSEIEALFAKNEDDVKFPPLSDNNYLDM